MKYLITLFTMSFALLFTVQANAALISLQTDAADYETGDAVAVSILIDNSGSNIAELDFSLNFDQALAEFGTLSFNAVNTQWAMLTDANLTTSNSLSIYSLWFDNLDVPAGVFELASATFTAQTDLDANAFSLGNIFAADANGNEIHKPTQVSEPNTLAILLLGLGLIRLRRKV